MVENYKELKMWQLSMDLCEEIYKVSENFPKKETYTLTSQMRRSAISVPSNIAEGFARRHPKEFRQFLAVSQGSLVELETQIELAKRLKYVEENIADNMIGTTDHIGRMITKFYKTLL